MAEVEGERERGEGRGVGVTSGSAPKCIADKIMSLRSSFTDRL